MTRIDIINTKAQKNSIVINDSNVHTGIVYKNKTYLHNSNFWHKFTIFSTDGLDRNTVLKSVLDYVYPLDLIPVNYDRNHVNSYFLARNCGAAIEKLCKDNLLIPFPGNPKKPFKVQINLKYSTTSEYKVDVHSNIISVLNQKFSSITKKLSLDSFYKTPELIEFCPLFQPKIMHFVLHLAHGLQPTKVVLSNNELRHLEQLESLASINVSSFNFSHNLISDISQISILKEFKNITELSFTGNPLCDKFEDAYSYIRAIRELCPKLQILDGVAIINNGLPVFKRNFLCDSQQIDLVNQFLEQFFTSFDCRNRQLMEDMYHKDAVFSLTSTYHSYQLSSTFAQLHVYKNLSRNLKKLADMSKAGQYLFKGSTEIINIFKALPATEHDPYSFTTDLMYHTPKCCMVVVNGVFREQGENLLEQERILGFSRTFILECDNNEYSIINDMLHVCNALSAQQTNAFTTSKLKRDNTIPIPETPLQREQLVETVQELTSLNKEWSIKLLEECGCDLRKTLLLFVDLYKVGNIPPSAFEV